MEKVALIILVYLMISTTLGACSPSHTKLAQQATEIAANFFATQTAQATTLTPTPTITRTDRKSVV